ncbi:mycofactocin precursor MftA [Actinomadura formosensis]|nr:mycofactocin precursor MftA [Actinomadura formosensis]
MDATPSETQATAQTRDHAEDIAEDAADSLIEEVSIDGMCGVY